MGKIFQTAAVAFLLTITASANPGYSSPIYSTTVPAHPYSNGATYPARFPEIDVVRTQQRIRAEHLANDEKLKKGWAVLLVAIHRITLKPLHHVCVWFVDQVDHRFDEEQQKSIMSHVFWKLVAPWLALIVILQLTKVIAQKRFHAVPWATFAMLVLFIAYDGGYSLTASFWSLMKVIAFFAGLVIFANAKNEQSECTPSCDSSAPATSDTTSGEGEEADGSFTAIDTQNREYCGRGDTMIRRDDNATFDRRNDGSWVSRYGDEVVREKGPGD